MVGQAAERLWSSVGLCGFYWGRIGWGGTIRGRATEEVELGSTDLTTDVTLRGAPRALYTESF